MGESLAGRVLKRGESRGVSGSDTGAERREGQIFRQRGRNQTLEQKTGGRIRNVDVRSKNQRHRKDTSDVKGESIYLVFSWLRG